MNPRDFAALFERDLTGFSALLDRFDNEADIWRTSPAAPNSPGTLALHVTGNLRHFVGAVLGGSAYVRHRDEEFTARNVPRDELKAGLSAAVRESGEALRGMTAADLETGYPLELPVGRIRTGLFLLHLCTHLSYHLGQADGHRRWVAEDGVSLNSVPIPSEPEESS